MTLLPVLARLQKIGFGIKIARTSYQAHKRMVKKILQHVDD